MTGTEKKPRGNYVITKMWGKGGKKVKNSTEIGLSWLRKTENMAGEQQEVKGAVTGPSWALAVGRQDGATGVKKLNQKD